jgi:NAD-dependent dihydropyrimidine dehydrogenase PreA subunit
VNSLLTIDQLLCTGCAACVGVCPSGALRLDEQPVPTLVSALCDECLACLDVCPAGAIQRITSAELAPAVGGEVIEGEIVGGEALPAPTDSCRLAPQPPLLRTGLAGSALAFVGNWLLPRAADALLGAVERRLAGGANSARLSQGGPMTRPAGRQHRQRRRGG